MHASIERIKRCFFEILMRISENGIRISLNSAIARKILKKKSTSTDEQIK